MTGQDTQVLQIARGHEGDRGPTRQTWVPILRAKGGTLEGRVEGDGRGGMSLTGRNQAGVGWLQRGEEARGQ